jgi:hypothetical protein
MKLFAFRDQETGRKGVARPLQASKHVYDLYTLTALLTRDEYDALASYRDRYGSHPIGLEAAGIVRRFFVGRGAPGALRLLERAGLPPGNQLDDFLALLSEVFNTQPR